MKRHQAMIAEAELPGALERYAQAEQAGAQLVAAGFERIGVDHFARPGDSLAIAARSGRLQRNFQGYTVDSADALIGLGASAIGRLPQGYVQNEPAIAEYERRTEDDGLAALRGLALTEDDRLRAEVIERLMCDLAFSARSVEGRRADLADALIESARAVVEDDVDGFVAATPDGFRVTARGRPFVRTIAARFYAYLPANKARHSVAV
jgi:oxygen-independent coproporphyrinogen-3 oxidase